MDVQTAQDRPKPAYDILRADGYDLDVADDAGVLVLTIVAGPDACAECLVPQELMASMMEKMLDPSGAAPPSLRLNYPPVDASH